MVKAGFNQVKLIITELWKRILRDLLRMVDVARRLGPSQLQLWLLSAVLGSVVGFVAYYFTELVQAATRFFYRSDTNNLLYYIHAIPWWWVVLIPVIGGLITGLILWYFTPDGRVRSISHVIEGAALRNGRVEEREGLASAAASFVTLSMGGSTGQEGPLVHLGAVISSRLSNWLHVNGMTARDFLACAAAAAIGSTFNAPIAGLVFAHEIILRHYSVSSFTPITIASVMGTITGHLLTGGNFVEIRFFELAVTQYTELPAFILLGMISGLVAVLTIRSIFIAEDIGDMISKNWGLKMWMRPMIAGLLLGLLALGFPHIIGIGYQTTVKALMGHLTVSEVIILVVIKVIAVAITVGGRMGGGIFSPSLMIGALTGLAFGNLAVYFGGGVGSEQLYALAGMAAVSAAVLGAPLSTSLIVFEMTGDWAAALAVLASVSVATGIANRMVDKSFFLTQLERRELHIAAGPQAYLLGMFMVRAHMKPLKLDEAAIEELREIGAVIAVNHSFEEAYPIFERLNVTSLLVLSTKEEGQEDREILGQLDYLDVLRTYSHALADTSAEEHD